ncbi:phosphatidate cytidylyltransferase [Parapedobacter deserti]|uniref:Phosphatidate cytidylyltransferase n=1 Tax=Parapedobacter deserti TaxID=1912957 RepID=A0ABV7JQ29_9SPHI
MRVRTITAFFFVAVVLASILLSVYLFAIFFMLLSVYCLSEFYRIIADSAGTPQRLLGLSAGAALFGLYTGYCLGWVPLNYLMLIVPLVSAIFIAPLYKKQEKPFIGIAYTLLGIVYVILPFASFLSLGFLSDVYDYRIPLGFILILWANDTGAYLVGKLFGKHRLFERISPKKTWEGFVGGVLLALITSMVLAYYFPQLAQWQWLVMALIIALFGTFGDLVESMLKRSQQVKDSGAVLPGHGGLLDRFDGLLLAGPAVLAFLLTVL